MTYQLDRCANKIQGTERPFACKGGGYTSTPSGLSLVLDDQNLTILVDGKGLFYLR